MALTITAIPEKPRFPTDIGIYAPYLGDRQTFTKGGINISLQNLAAGKRDPSTGFDFRYHHFGTKTASGSITEISP
jgi:hypothetical protein